MDAHGELDEETALLSNTQPVTEVQKPTPLPKLQITLLLLLQLAEPITSQCIFPFVNQLVSSLEIVGGDERKVGYYAGFIESLFFVTQAFTVLQWSRVSDYVGRKPVLLIGLIGLCLSMLSFGLSTTFIGLVISRCIAGMLNGNIGVMKSMVGELTDSTNMAQAFAFMPIMWSVGATFAPMMGGALARPQDRWPHVFSGKFWETYPYFLPCAVAASYTMFAFIIVLLFLKETVGTRLPKPVESESPAILPPSESMPLLNKAVDEPVPLRDLLVSSILIPIVTYASAASLEIAMLALMPLFYSTPIQIGGLGFSPSLIGLWMGALGLSNGIFQMLFFPTIVRHFGPKRTVRTGISCFIPIFMLFPLISLSASQGAVTPLTWGLMSIQLVLIVLMGMTFGCVFMFITSAAPNKRSLGTTNGLAQTTVSIARAFGPASATSLFAFSMERSKDGILGLGLGGNLVYVVLLLASGAALFLASRLPEKMKDRD